MRGREVASPGLFPGVPYKIGNLLQTNSCPVEQALSYFTTPFAVHYEEIRNHLRKTATNRAKIHSLTRKSEHLRINQIQ